MKTQAMAPPKQPPWWRVKRDIKTLEELNRMREVRRENMLRVQRCPSWKLQKHYAYLCQSDLQQHWPRFSLMLNVLNPWFGVVVIFLLRHHHVNWLRSVHAWFRSSTRHFASLIILQRSWERGDSVSNQSLLHDCLSWLVLFQCAGLCNTQDPCTDTCPNNYV